MYKKKRRRTDAEHWVKLLLCCGSQQSVRMDCSNLAADWLVKMGSHRRIQSQRITVTHVLVSMILLFTFLCAGCNQQRPEEPLSQKIDDYLSQMNFWGTVLITQGGDTILRKAYGMADAENNVKNAIDTSFLLCSVTKQFTGAAILCLEAEGKISASDTLDKYFPEYEKLSAVSVSDLLAMKGGFGDFFDWPFISKNHMVSEYRVGISEVLYTMSIEDMEDYIISEWKQKSDDYIYSNSDYFMLGRIIECASGMTYQEYVTEKLFVPAGMTNSGFVDTLESAFPHNHSGGVYYRQKWPFPLLYSAGSIVTTADDLDLWLDAYWGGKLFPEFMLERISGQHEFSYDRVERSEIGHYNNTIRVTFDYNYGWYTYYDESDDAISFHEGSMVGFDTFVLYDQGSQTKIILLSNNTDDRTSKMGEIVQNVYNWSTGKNIDW